MCRLNWDSYFKKVFYPIVIWFLNWLSNKFKYLRTKQSKANLISFTKGKPKLKEKDNLAKAEKGYGEKITLIAIGEKVP